jgi:hypothetical protein
LRYHGLAAVGVPGVEHWKEDVHAGLLDGITNIFVVIEPGKAGKKFRLLAGRSKIGGRARAVSLNGFKDPSEMHIADPATFVERFQAELDQATPVKKPIIVIRHGDLEPAVDELEGLLIAAGDLYQRGGLIARTAVARLPTWDGKAVLAQVIEEVGDHAMIEHAEAVAEFTRFTPKGDEISASPMPLVRALKDRRNRLRLPIIVGLANAPSIAIDGTLLDVPGFDRSTGIVYDPLGVCFPSVPKEATLADAKNALARLAQLIQTFEFETPADRAVALSLFLTAVTRRSLPTSPLHALDAAVAGVGKSMMVDVGSILSTGHRAGVTAWGESREEAEKRLSAILMRGDPLISLDNCELPLDGVLLNQCLTQQKVELRILGYSKMITAATAALVCATGNNLVLKGDLTRRAVVGRFRTDTARPELRKFNYSPIDDAERNRGELVAAALTVLKAYFAAGRPAQPDPPLGSFELWSGTVRGALIWLGQGDPVKTQDRLREKDPALAAVITVLTAWRARYGDTPVSASLVVADANQTERVLDGSHFADKISHPDLHYALMEVAPRSGKVDIRVFGQWLAKNADRIIELDDKTSVILKTSGILNGIRQWQVRSPPPPAPPDSQPAEGAAKR